MGSQNQNTFKKSATGQQPPEMALDYLSLRSIFLLGDLDDPSTIIYTSGADDPTIFQYHQLALDVLGSRDSAFFNNPQNTPLFQSIGKIESTTGFIIATTYSTTPEGSTTSTDHFSLVLGQMEEIIASETQETKMLFTPLFQTNGIIDDSNLYIAHECTYAAINDEDGELEYWSIHQEGDFNASLCYANELVMKFLSAPITDDDIKRAERWFTTSPEEVSLELQRLWNRDSVDFSTDTLKCDPRFFVIPSPSMDQ
ncbi:MAG: hypothetical protein JNL76_02895 [Alphaproteobacteria bacterium]|nr:hypothetical protein [Alphaproteobacteria bacterium]